MDTNLTLELFIGRGMIDKSLAKDIKEEMTVSGKELPEVLADFGIIGSKDDIWQMIASDLGTEFITLDNFQPDPNVQNMMPATLVRLHGALPVRHGPEGLYVCLVDPLNPQTVEDLRFALGQDIHVLIAPDYQISERINELYGGESAAMTDLMQELNNMQVNNETEDSAAAPVIRFVDLVITQAIKEKASDIHFEPFEKEFKIRYRVDGSLYEMQPPPVHLSVPVISRVKVMANMNIAERRVPQDGRIVKQIGNRAVDMRVSSLPTQYGESVVLRVLDRSSVNLNLDNLGLPPHIHEYILDTVHKPNGIFIVTGPTGAGKTTTLYAALREINTIDSKVLTAEDPVEYDIDGIIQIPINEAIGLDFPMVLRAFLRQDPDRILVGEMRDMATAQIAIPGIPDGPPGALHPAHERLRRRHYATGGPWAANLSWWQPPWKGCWPSAWCAPSARTAARRMNPPPPSSPSLACLPMNWETSISSRAAVATNAPTPATRAARGSTSFWISTIPCGT